jgi:transposase-like protein
MQRGQSPGQPHRPSTSPAARKHRERQLLQAIRLLRCTPPYPAYPTDPIPKLRNPHCPHCHAPKTHRWGTFSHRQRWKCTVCSRTFSDLTATPLARTRRLFTWLEFNRHLRLTETVRATARDLGLHRNTVLRWRHAAQDAMQHRERPQLDTPQPLGLRILLFTPTHLQSRTQRHPKRPRRPHSLLIIDPLTPVPPAESHLPLLALDLGPQAQPTISLESALRRLLPPSPLGGPYPILTRGTPPLDLRHALTPVPTLAIPHLELVPILTLRSYLRPQLDTFWREAGRFLGAFRHWLLRFRGVAPQNLQRYLAWFRALTASVPRPPSVPRSTSVPRPTPPSSPHRHLRLGPEPQALLLRLMAGAWLGG